MIKKISISTRRRVELYDITDKVQGMVKESKVKSGVCQIFIPHTTAGITINENADPSVRSDITSGLESLVPAGGRYEHTEGNADAHIKSSLVGINTAVFIEDGNLKLGTWQGIFFCEFDGPRQRNVLLNITEK